MAWTKSTSDCPTDERADATTTAVRRIDALLVYASVLMLPLGLMMIFLGWYGAARAPYVFEQIPYLISGGLLGLGLVVAAGLLYIGSWISRGVSEQRRSAAETNALLAEIRSGLTQQDSDPLLSLDLVDELPQQAAMNGTRGRRRARTGSHRVVVTAAGSMLHREDCQVVARRSDLHEVDPTTDDRQSCRLCNPLRVPADARSAR